MKVCSTESLLEMCVCLYVTNRDEHHTVGGGLCPLRGVCASLTEICVSDEDVCVTGRAVCVTDRDVCPSEDVHYRQSCVCH